MANGGFEIVYRAHQQEIGLQVAVKEYFPIELAVRDAARVQPRDSNCRKHISDALERFLVEAKQLVEFEACPNIVSFRENGTAYLAMDFEHGMSLSRLLAARE